MKDKLVSKELIRHIHPVFKGKCGDYLINVIFKIGGINTLNAIYDNSKQFTGLQFATDVLDKMEITRIVENKGVVETLKNKPFITVSNHPYGHIDGIIMASVMGALRSDYKMMVNWLLTQIDTMEEFFIGVNPFPKDNKMAEKSSSVGGIRQCMEHLQENHSLGLFPAGGVSRPDLRGRVMDREWQSSSIRLIKTANVPVIPVYISGCNSLFYQILGHIGWRTRSTWLLHELSNKKGKTIHIRLGNIIQPEEIQAYEQTETLERFLYSRTYALRDEFYVL